MIKKTSLILLLMVFNSFLLSSQTEGEEGIYLYKDDENVNYDESKVGDRQLPSLLGMSDGGEITSSREWLKDRRPTLLQLFKDHVYGDFPGRAPGQHYKINSIDCSALGGKAISKQITIFFTEDVAGPSMDVLLYLPIQAQKPVPVFAGLNFYGNQGVHQEPQIKITSRWVRNTKKETGTINNNRATEVSRGVTADKWPIETIIDEGYAVATAYYGDLEPDYSEGWQRGIRCQLQEELRTDISEWGAIGAWAWGLSRMMDYFEKDLMVDENKTFVIGHSRLGKAALWAGANDTRFAAVISNNSGEGGAALTRRWYGETISKLNAVFPHWFRPSFKKYNDTLDLLPVDQHMLLALIAPRPLYVASAEDDPWADPKGEFLGAKYAEPAYQLFGKEGLGVKRMPPVDHPVGGSIHYHIRTGRHGITPYDWQQYINFADKHFGRNLPVSSK